MRTRFASCETLADLFARTCAWKQHTRLFTDDQGAVLTGSEAWSQARRFASVLQAKGMGPGDVVAFLCLGSAWHAAAWFGAISGKFVASTLHTRDESPERISKSIKWLGAKVLVYDAQFKEIAQWVKRSSDNTVQLVELPCEQIFEVGSDNSLSYSSLSDYEADRPNRDDVAVIALSSGSTGTPKGVVHSQSSLMNCAVSGQAMLEGVDRRDTLMVALSPSYAAWILFVLAGVAGKACIYFVRKFSPALILEKIQSERTTILPLVPAMWRMLLNEDVKRHDLTSLRLAIAGGESPTPDDFRQIRDRLCRRVMGAYMACEAGNGSAIILTTEDMQTVDETLAPAGMPTVGADVRIVNPDGPIDELMPPGETGELVVTGSSVGTGYWKDPALTEKKFVDGWWRSGDLGHIDERGYVWVSGRADNVINTGGIKVHAEEIEAALVAHELVSSCAVVGRKDDRFGQRIEAFIVATDPGLTEDDLRAFVDRNAGITGHKVPKVFHFVEALPTGLTGKIDRKALRQADIETLTRRTRHQP